MSTADLFPGAAKNFHGKNPEVQAARDGAADGLSGDGHANVGQSYKHTFAALEKAIALRNRGNRQHCVVVFISGKMHMASPLKAAPAPIEGAQALNEAAMQSGWPILCDESCDFSQPLLSDLLALWRSEAGDGIPDRNAMTARKLQPFMRNIAIYERIGVNQQRRYRVRLMGSGIVQYYGELTGKYVDEVVDETYLPRWYAISDVSLMARKPVRLILRADTFDKSYMVAEYLCAPLKADDGVERFVLLGIVFDGRRPWNVVEAEGRKKLGLPPVG